MCKDLATLGGRAVMDRLTGSTVVPGHKGRVGLRRVLTPTKAELALAECMGTRPAPRATGTVHPAVHRLALAFKAAKKAH